MKSIPRNILAVVLGLVIGSAVNMTILKSGGNIIPMPDSIDPTNMDALKNNAHLLQPKHYVFPLLAHAIGTLAGTLTTVMIADSRKKIFGYITASSFLLGGLIMCLIIPAPLWFKIADLLLAYIPMAWLAQVLGDRTSSTSPPQ